jgi:hypothetical protein
MSNNLLAGATVSRFHGSATRKTPIEPPDKYTEESLLFLANVYNSSARAFKKSMV